MILTSNVLYTLLVPLELFELSKATCIVSSHHKVIRALVSSSFHTLPLDFLAAMLVYFIDVYYRQQPPICFRYNFSRHRTVHLFSPQFYRDKIYKLLRKQQFGHGADQFDGPRPPISVVSARLKFWARGPIILGPPSVYTTNIRGAVPKKTGPGT